MRLDRDLGTWSSNEFRVANHSEVGQTKQYKRVYRELSLELKRF